MVLHGPDAEAGDGDEEEEDDDDDGDGDVFLDHFVVSPLVLYIYMWVYICNYWNVSKTRVVNRSGPIP